jgi:hypothetical protein
MRFFPYENYYIISKLNPEEAQAKLGKAVMAPDNRFFKFRMLSLTSANAPFVGYTANGVFEFKPNVHRNSSNITGSIEPWKGGSRVHVKITMAVLTAIFMVTCLGMGTVVCFAFIPKLLSHPPNYTYLWPIGIFLALNCIITGKFKWECWYTRFDLLDALDGKKE